MVDISTVDGNYIRRCSSDVQAIPTRISYWDCFKVVTQVEIAMYVMWCDVM
jgi:hypothetical protein